MRADVVVQLARLARGDLIPQLAAQRAAKGERAVGGRELGLRRADVTQFAAIEDKANRAWGRAQAALWMGAFRKPTIRAEYSAAETFPGSDREGRCRMQ